MQEQAENIISTHTENRQKTKQFQSNLSHKILPDKGRFMQTPFPISSLHTNGTLSARAISAIHKSNAPSEIQVNANGSPIIRNIEDSQMLSGLGLSGTQSDILKSRKHRIFLDNDTIKFKAPELSEYYYNKDLIQAPKLASRSQSEEYRIANQISNNNSFFDFMNNKGDTNLIQSTKINNINANQAQKAPINLTQTKNNSIQDKKIVSEKQTQLKEIQPSTNFTFLYIFFGALFTITILLAIIFK